MNDFCKSCTTYVACDLNSRCKLADSAKVEVPTPAADAQDSSYRAEIESLTSKLAVQSKLTRDAEQQRDQYQAAMLRQNEVNNELYLRHQAEDDRLKAELTAANDSLIAARAQIAALVADQRETDADRQRELREYVTTRQFHQQQASMAPSRGVSIPAAELAVTAEEDEAFAALEQRVTRAENAFLILQGRVNTAHDRLDLLKEI